uniref:Acid phosphatase n=1 Tax=Bursaphelenchus xylophilus TaxID=6326 RepID=A0A1I7RZN0_BURXY
MFFNLFVLSASIGLIEANLQLVSVQSIFRHGDRAPSKPYPNNPHGPEHWPNGWSQLTKVGAAQTQDLGRYYRLRYVDQLSLLNSTNLLTEVRMRSTSKKRAIESADNVMLGLMGTQIEQTNMDIHHDYKQDLLLKPNSVDCPRYDQILDADNNKLFALYNSTFATTFEQLSKWTGMPVDMSNIDKVFDSLFREAVHGLDLPVWAMETVYDPINRRFITIYELVLELKRVQRLGEFNSAEKSKLRSGFLLGQIMEFMKNNTNGKANPKLMLYSSHDATLTSLLYSINASDEQLTPYAAAITFELWKDPEGPHQPTYYVKVGKWGVYKISIKLGGGTYGRVG